MIRLLLLLLWIGLLTKRPRPPDGGDEPGPGPRPKRPKGGNSENVAAVQAGARRQLQQGQPNTGQTVDGRYYDPNLPPGWYRKDGRVRDDKGNYAKDPNASPTTHNRGNQYPHDYSPKTHDTMVQRWTDQGRNPEQYGYHMDENGTLRDANGDRVPRDQLTWKDKDGNPVEYYSKNPDGSIRTDRLGKPIVNLTYDHKPSIVEHWINHGHDQSAGDRAKYYDDPNNMTPMGRGPNGSDGATNGMSFSDAEPGDNHSW